MTVVGLTRTTRAVSRIPLPLRAMFTLCCFTAGRRPWFRFGTREKWAAGRRCGARGSAVRHDAACHTAPHRYPDSLDNGPVHRSWRPPRWTMTDGPFYQHVNSFGTPPAWSITGQTRVLRKHSETHIERHTPLKRDASPYDGNWSYWGTRRGKYIGLDTVRGKLLKHQGG